ncbi:hypothetical protein WR25_11552 isoform B [Diploscapter pachys]|uniref:ShKT domain-containing protein n=1 Tax=Diploscapter pachys TaxID=2018661 RepID=A0A2A2JPY7_9BILA|nr:hypothetical protein WR25_11552 isoform B [Diploscapter pachys]
MNANCRKSCDRCSRSRAQDRGDSSSNTNSKTNLNNRGSNNENNRVRTPSKTPQAPGYKPIRPKKSRNFTESCYNENICCQYWATIELCGVYPQPMAGTCPVSCSFCVPKTYYHGTCADYSVHCPYWKRLGECEKNTWMSENCRKSCDTCTNMLDLRKLCQGPMAPLAKEIKWMKSHRRSGLIDGWQGSSRDWNRLSVDAQNYGAQHDQQNSGDAHPTVPSYKPDIKKNTWLAIYGSIFLVWVICLLKNIVMWSDYEDIKEKEAVKDAIFYQQLILSIFGAKCIFFTFKRDGAWSQDRTIPIYSPLMNAGDWLLYIVYILAIYFTFALMIIVYTQIRKEDKAAEEAKKTGEVAKPINNA